MKSSPHLALLAGLALPSVALAHAGHGVASGLLHPLSGLDHLLAFAVMGLWAARSDSGGGGVLAAALLAMALGGGLGATGFALPYVEYGILASLLVLGLWVAAGVRLPRVGAAAIAFFAVLHGYAHGTEMPGTASVAFYVAGFLAATAAVQACGFWLGRRLGQHPVLLRAAGALVAVGGLALAVAR